MPRVACTLALVLAVAGGSPAGAKTVVVHSGESIQEALDAFLVELLGELPEVTHRWAGIFGLTQDLLAREDVLRSVFLEGAAEAEVLAR